MELHFKAGKFINRHNIEKLQGEELIYVAYVTAVDFEEKSQNAVYGYSIKELGENLCDRLRENDCKHWELSNLVEPLNELNPLAEAEEVALLDLLPSD